MSLEKPPLGSPCNGCGLCCRLEVCSAGAFTQRLVASYGERAPGPCPALMTQADGSSACGMVLRPRDYAWGRGSAHELRAAIMLLIGAGAGCDELGEDEDDALIADIQDAYVRRQGREAIERAVKKWYGL